MDYVSDFIVAMQKQGFEIAQTPIADDKTHTVKANGERNASFSYRLAIDSDGAVGWFRCFKQGVLHKYHSRSDNKGLSPAEQDALRQRRAEAKRKRDAEIICTQEKVAQEAKRFWATLKPADGRDAYSQKKGIIPHGARWFPGGKVAWFEFPLNACLVIPIYNAKGICNLQLVSNSVKLFLPGAELTGCYGVVTKGALAGDVWVAEGYATSCTVSDVLDKTVVVAFNAGNLKPVADVLSRKYPDAEIIIAADNDHEKEAEGKGNAGITKAKESGYRYSAPPPAPGVTDWNDYAANHGFDAAKNTLLAGLGNGGEAGIASQATPSPVAAIDNDWMQRLTYNDKGGLEKNNINNLALYLENHEKFKGLFWYDEFFRQIMVRRKNNIDNITDEFIVDMILMCEKMGLNKNFDLVNKVVLKVAKDRPRNPAREYFDSLKWDGVERLDKWLSYYFGADDEPPEYLAFIGKKWLTAATKRIYEPGCKFDHILVLEGETGKGKSTALKVLATFGDESRCYCTDAFSFGDIGDKDSISKTNGKIIIELAEMVGHNRKETEEIKSWITKQWDEARPAYSRHHQIFPRMFVIACTTENQEYLNDPKGNRRYWPFLVKSVDLEALAKDRKQLWAEAVHWYKSGLYIGPTEEEYELAKIQQDKRMESDPWESAVEKAIMEMGLVSSFTTADVMGQMGLALRDKDYKSKRRVIGVLMGLGYKNKTIRDSGRVVRRWSVE